jgi:hypothetical protein
MRWRRVVLAIVHFIIATLILNSNLTCAIQMAVYFKWIYRLSKIAITVITIPTLNIAMLNLRRITTAFLSALEVRLQY